jgi:hypothetical protein
MPVDNRTKTEGQSLTTDPALSGILNGHTTNTNGVISLNNKSGRPTTSVDEDDDDEKPPPPFKMPRAPPHVYSCFVVNRTNQPIECDVRYDGRPEEDTFNEDVHVTIPAKDEKYFPRKIFQPDLPESYCRWVKIITNIRVKKQNGKILEVDYPFDNVHQPIRNWEFHVREEGDILSKPPTRPANILKYENLDEYER